MSGARAWVVRLLMIGAALASVWFTLAFFHVSLSRLTYPFELEWMEGAIVDHGARIALGEPLYAAPSIEFIPFIYPPLYSYLLAAGYEVFGINLWWGRLLSLAATLCAAWVALRWIWVETRSAFLAVVGVGLFFASFRVCGAWFDLNRVDMVRLALLAGGMYLLGRDPTPRRLVASAALLALAFFAKQFALVFLAAGAALVLLRGLRPALLFTATGFGIAAAGAAILAFWSDGWFWYYCFELPFRNGMLWELVGTVWRNDVTARFPFLLGGAGAAGVAWLFAAERTGLHALPAVCVAAVCGVLASFFARVHFGGYDNTLIPLAYFTPIFLAVATGRVLRATRTPELRHAATAVFALVALLQFYSYDYDPAQQIPSDEQRAQGEHFLEVLRSTPDEVFLPFHGYYWSQTGKPMRFHVIGLHDEITSAHATGDGRTAIVPDHGLVPEEIAAAFAEGRFPVVLPDSQYYMNVIGPLLRGRYRPDPGFGREQEGDPFPTLPPPLTGMIVTPTGAWVPIQAAPARS